MLQKVLCKDTKDNKLFYCQNNCNVLKNSLLFQPDNWPSDKLFSCFLSKHNNLLLSFLYVQPVYIVLF